MITVDCPGCGGTVVPGDNFCERCGLAQPTGRDHVELDLGVAAGVGGLVLTVGVLQAAMAPMISAAILADEHDLEPQLANTVLGAGIVLSLVTVPLGNLLLGG